MLSALGGSGKQEKRSFSAVGQRFIYFITKYNRSTILFPEEQCKCGCVSQLSYLMYYQGIVRFHLWQKSVVSFQKELISVYTKEQISSPLH